MTEEFQYKAFLSYSHKDKKAGAWLHRQLEKYRLPKNLAGTLSEDGRGNGSSGGIGRIFRDRDELPAAEDLTEAVRKALETSEYMVVLCSPNSAASRWVNKEIIEFKRLRGDKYVLPIIIDGEPFASDHGAPEQECFPPAVRFKIAKTGGLSTLPAEPAAADARKDADGKQRAVLKLLAGLLDVGLDQLIEREMRRRQQRVTIITAGALAAVLVMATLTYEAMTARDAANRSRAEAEDLVEFMLTDLREKLEPVGRLDVLDAVGEKVLSYHDNQLAYEDARDDDIGRRARAYHLLAEMEYRRGNMDEAQTMFEQAKEATGELLKRDPNNTQRIFEHAQSVFWVGNQSFERGQFQETEVAFRRYKEMADRLVVLEPDNVDWLIEQAYGNHNMGDVYLRGLNKPREAIPFLEMAASLFERTYHERPESLFLKRYVAAQYLALSDAHRQFGHLRNVVSFRQKQREVLQELLVISADDRTLQEHMWLWYRAEGWLQTVLQQFNRAAENYEKAAQILGGLLEYEPDNNVLKEEAAILEFYRVELFLSMGKIEEAKESFRQANQYSKMVLGYEVDTNIHRIYLKYLAAYIEVYMAPNLDERNRLSHIVYENVNTHLLSQLNYFRARWLLSAIYKQRIAILLDMDDLPLARKLKAELWAHLEDRQIEQRPSLQIQLGDIALLVGDVLRAKEIRQNLVDRGYERTHSNERIIRLKYRLLGENDGGNIN